MRIGLLGGSFNPAHGGHLHISDAALKKLRLDCIWWLVSPQNPLKPERGTASVEHRVAQAKTIARHPRIIVSAIETEFGTRFTVDTIKALKHRFPRLRFVWLMGSDNLVQVPRWRHWQTIFNLVPVAIVTRPESALAARSGIAATCFRAAYRPADRHFSVATPPAWTVIEAKRNGLSSTALRTASPSQG